MSTWNSVQGSLGWNPPGQKGTSVSFYLCAQKIISLTCRLSAHMILSQYRWVGNLSAHVDAVAQCFQTLRRHLNDLFSGRFTERLPKSQPSATVTIRGQHGCNVTKLPSHVSANFVSLSYCLKIMLQKINENKVYTADEEIAAKQRFGGFFDFTTSCRLWQHHPCSFCTKFPGHSAHVMQVINLGTLDSEKYIARVKWQSLIHKTKPTFLLIYEDYNI